MHEFELFPRDVVAANLSCWRESDGGWHLRIATRLDGTRWHERAWDEYSSLTLSELVDVLLAGLSEAPRSV